MGFVEGTFTGLNHRDAVLGIENRSVQAPHLAAEFFADGQPGGIIGSAIDAQSGTQFLDGLFKADIGAVQCALSLNRQNIGIDTHTISSMIFLRQCILAPAAY